MVKVGKSTGNMKDHSHVIINGVTFNEDPFLQEETIFKGSSKFICNDSGYKLIYGTTRRDGMVISKVNGASLSNFGNKGNKDRIYVSRGARISKEMFNGCSELMEIVIPSKIVKIGALAFNRCENLKSINIQDDVSIIEKEAFLGCLKLKVINIPKNLSKEELDGDYLIRRAAVDYNIPLITNARLASAFIQAFTKYSLEDLKIVSLHEYYEN